MAAPRSWSGSAARQGAGPGRARGGRRHLTASPLSAALRGHAALPALPLRAAAEQGLSANVPHRRGVAQPQGQGCRAAGQGRGAQQGSEAVGRGGCLVGPSWAGRAAALNSRQI